MGLQQNYLGHPQAVFATSYHVYSGFGGIINKILKRNLLMFVENFVIYTYPIRILSKMYKRNKIRKVMGRYEPTSTFNSREHYLKTYFKMIRLGPVRQSYILAPIIMLICYITGCADDILIWGNLNVDS
jgi:hypothetical protein